MKQRLLNLLTIQSRWLAPSPGATIALGAFMFISTLLMTDYVPPGTPDNWRQARLMLALWGGLVSLGTIRLLRAVAEDRRQQRRRHHSEHSLCPR